jgi:sugar phosphate isomerase/epimerase
MTMKVALTATPSVARFAPILLRGDVADAFRLAAELGYQGVDLHLRQPDDIDRTAVKKLAADHTLGIPTVGTGMAAGEDGLTFADPDPEVRRRAVERIKEHIRLAAYVESAVTIGLLNGRLGNDEQQRVSRRAAAQECLAECCRAAADVGVIILLEPLNRYECDYLNTLADVVDTIQTVGAPNLKLLADTFHMNIEEADLPASLRQSAAWLGHVHLVDTNRQAPGRGHLNIRDILHTLQDIGYQGYLSFEVLPLPGSRLAAEQAIRTVQESLSSL